jgi:uridine kinase
MSWQKFLHSRLFWAGLIVKLACLPFFGSYYLKDLFIPFLDSAVIGLGNNPWSLLPPHYFPYGSALFVILFLPRLLAYSLIGDAALGTSALGIALVKAPLLALDFLLLWTLIRIARGRSRQIYWYYWLNPIAFYITYVHGQLDVASAALCVLGLFHLTAQNTKKSAIFFSVATLCKFQVIAVIPLILAYLWNRLYFKQALITMAQWLGTWGLVSALGFLPLIFANNFFYASTSSPEAFRIFGIQARFGPDQVLYVGLFLFLIVLGRLCVSTRITERGLIFGSGIIFGILLLATNTMPGWYFWVLPFLCLFFALYENVPRLLFVLLNIFYLIHFPLVRDFVGSSEHLAWGISFTLLQTALAGTLFALWRIVIDREATIDRRTKPVVLGLAGDSGAGKNHLTQVLVHLFNARSSLVLEGDDYHKWERGHENWDTYTHLNPRANHLLKMASHAVQLSQGKPVVQPHYDHSTGRFSASREIRPEKFVIIQGLHTLYLRGMRDFLDLKVFIVPHEIIRLAWKINRDVKDRSYPIEKVLESFARREQDCRDHIDPQREFADWILEYFPYQPITRDEVIAGKQPIIGVRHTIWNDAPVLELFEMLSDKLECEVEFQLVPNDINRITIQVVGNPSADRVRELAHELFPNLRHITRGRQVPLWCSGYDGINQLVTIALLSQQQWGTQNDRVH